MAFKTFVNGFPLNASELNEYLMNQSIAVFVDSTARSAAITSPVEGQFTYLTGTDLLQKWTGSAWETFGGSSSLTANRAVATDGAGALSASTVTATELGYLSGVTSSIQTQLDAKTPGMVKTGAVSFSAASAVNVNNVFSSSYKNYKIFIQTTLNSGGANGLIRMRVSGADNTSANYFQQRINAFETTLSAQRVTSQTSFSVYDIQASGSSAEITMFNPFDTAKTYYQSHGLYDAGSPELNLRSGAFNATTSFDGFTLFPTTGTITGTIKVYGLAD
jgi:hypothetical protein